MTTARDAAALPRQRLSTRGPKRGPVHGTRCAVASDHWRASLVGLDVLRRGGSAVDAAIATSAVKVVLKPHRSHLGGDAFVLLWRRDTNDVECLNAGGRAPRRARLEDFADGIPERGARASTVPGLVDSWVELHARHGRLPFAELLRPAVELAADGFPVSQRLTDAMTLLVDAGDGFPARDHFLAGGARPYRPGETFRQPDLARTLERIAQDGRDGFYAGPIGRAIIDAMSSADGLIDDDDLAQPTALWYDPVATTYAGCTVYEQAPPSQGLILLEALNIVEQFPLARWGPAGADAVHVMVEAIRLAFADVRHHLADPLIEAVPVDRLLSKEHARARAAEIDLARAKQHGPAMLPGDTTSFVVADASMAVCFIQSVYSAWGSGFVVPGTGVLMNNRMLCFHTDPASPNRVAPGKCAVHTLNNFLILRDGDLVLGGGTPGADFQVQVNLQIIANVLDWELDLQSAVDAPHWVSLGPDRMGIERRYPDELIAGLEARGHHVQRFAHWNRALSRSQLLASIPDGGWAAASDLRGEGAALAL